MNVTAMTLAERTAVICSSTRSMSIINLMKFCYLLKSRHIVFAGHEAKPKEVYGKYDRQKFHNANVGENKCNAIAIKNIVLITHLVNTTSRAINNLGSLPMADRVIKTIFLPT